LPSTDDSTAPSLDGTVLYEVHDRVALITLNRPDRLNALLPGMGEVYAAALKKADADPDVGAIVVTGAGRGFCSGADLGVLAEGAEALDGYLDGQSLSTLPLAAFTLGTPVVTAINGPCAGIGFVLALSADMRFAAPTATLSTSFSRLGLIAEYASSWLLTRLAGLATATDLLLSGRTIDAAEAKALGLVNAVDEDVVGTAMAWAHDATMNCSPSALAVIKQQLLRVDSQGLEDAVDDSLAEMRVAFTRPDLGEAVMAKIEKRAPRFPPR